MLFNLLSVFLFLSGVLPFPACLDSRLAALAALRGGVLFLVTSFL